MNAQEHAELRALAAQWRQQTGHVYPRCADDLDRWLTAHPAAEGWRDISTAPKDGSLILLCGSAVWPSNYTTVATGYWFDGGDGSYGWITRTLAKKGGLSLASYTGWQPLPAPPAAEEPTP